MEIKKKLKIKIEGRKVLPVRPEPLRVYLKLDSRLPQYGSRAPAFLCLIHQLIVK